MAGISFSEWAAAMEAKCPPPRPDDALTLSEWQRKLGVDAHTIRKRLRDGVANGTVRMLRCLVPNGGNGGGGLRELDCYQPIEPKARKTK